MNASSNRQLSLPVSVLLLLGRLAAGGAFVLAGYLKLLDPFRFMLIIQAFDFGWVPKSLIPYAAYAIPWTEVVVGSLLVLGYWARPAAAITGVIYVFFTGILLALVASGADAECGCFGGLWGLDSVGWMSILRNLVLLGATGAVLWFGPGRLSADLLESALTSARAPEEEAAPTPAAEV